MRAFINTLRVTLYKNVGNHQTCFKETKLHSYIFPSLLNRISICHDPKESDLIRLRFIEETLKNAVNLHSHVIHRMVINRLTHWGRVTHICVVKLTIIGSDNSLSPGRRQAIIWTKAGILLIGPLGTNFVEILVGIQTFSFEKMHLKMSSAKWRPFCLGLNVLTH